jgi:hypothetical protein
MSASNKPGFAGANDCPKAIRTRAAGGQTSQVADYARCGCRRLAGRCAATAGGATTPVIVRARRPPPKVKSGACRRSPVVRDRGVICPRRPLRMGRSWPGTRGAAAARARRVARASCVSWPGARPSGATGTSPMRCGSAPTSGPTWSPPSGPGTARRAGRCDTTAAVTRISRCTSARLTPSVPQPDRRGTLRYSRS